ncbi:MAG: TatD family hydrolase [Candidatus Liptonbacteria bacterium]|nr:TatD family hydrolase [Candidatus Liptonbacteria bacterium]
MKFFDAHTHVQFAAYDADRKEVIKRALESDVFMINVGTQRNTSASAVKLANEYAERLYASIGLHPIHTEKSYHDEKELGGGEAAKSFTSVGEDFDYDYYKKLALDPKTVAIGECGLDYYRLSEETKEKQKEALVRQIELAKDVKKPLMIHCRNAFADLIETLQSPSSKLQNPGVVHFFTGTADDAKKLMELGFSFTFGGVVTFPPKAGQPRADTPNYNEVIKMIPIDRILSETDAPYVAPVPYRGKRNEPAYVVEVVKKLAEIKGISNDEMADKVFENSKRIFIPI